MCGGAGPARTQSKKSPGERVSELGRVPESSLFFLVWFFPGGRRFSTSSAFGSKEFLLPRWCGRVLGGNVEGTLSFRLEMRPWGCW